jgi:AraC-like DNA-binding protein
MKYFYRYLPLSDEARLRSLFVIAGGYTQIPPGAPYPPFQHPSDHQFSWDLGRTLHEYQLIYITRGEGVFESKSGGINKIKAGQLISLFPGEWHRYHPEHNTGWDEYWVAFNGKYAAEYLSENRISCDHPVIEVGSNDLLLSNYFHLMDEIRLEQVGYQNIASAHAIQIMAIAAASVLRKDFEGTEILKIIERIKCILLEQHDCAINVENMSKDLGVSYSWLRRMFKQYTGLSPAQYHLHLRINRACELLRNTILPITDISNMLGFSSSYYFSSIFKEKMGYSPREYRALIQTRE